MNKVILTLAAVLLSLTPTPSHAEGAVPFKLSIAYLQSMSRTDATGPYVRLASGIGLTSAMFAIVQLGAISDATPSGGDHQDSFQHHAGGGGFVALAGVGLRAVLLNQDAGPAFYVEGLAHLIAGNWEQETTSTFENAAPGFEIGAGLRVPLARTTHLELGGGYLRSR